MTKRKILRTLLPVGITLIFAAGYYYYAPPAFNFHDPELWWFLIVLCAVYGVLRLIFGHRTLIENGKPTWKGFLGFAAAAVLFLVYFIIQFFSGPLFHAGTYAAAGAERITTGDFASEIQMVENGEITDIAIMDTTTAEAMGRRQIGSLGTLATQYELGQFMTTTVNAQPKKVATLGYGSLLFIALTLISGSRDYNGSGMSLIGRIMEGEQVSYGAFLWKMLFTAVVLGAGFKGGEIVPTLCVGAAFGAAAARLLGLDQALWAACAMTGLFVGVTNCPIATVILAFEMFGYGAMPYFALIVPVSFTLSGYYGLYKSQKFAYSKLKAEYINRKSE